MRPPTLSTHGATSITLHAKKFNSFNMVSIIIKQGDETIAYLDAYSDSPDQKLELIQLEPMDLTYPVEAVE